MRKDVTDDMTAVLDILDRAEFATLALLDLEGPYSVPVNFACLDGVLYFHTGKKGRKYAAIVAAEKAGTPVAFSAAVDLEMKTGDKACQWGYKFRSVLGQGRVRIVQGAAERRLGLGVIMKKYAGSDDFPYDDKILGITDVIAVHMDRVSARLKQS